MLALALALSGCFETKEEFTLNPDGSGKVVIESSFTRAGGGMFDQGNQASLEELLQTTVKGIVQDAAGVEAWRDVSFRRLPDGRIYFKGTAYFRDLKEFSVTGCTYI